MTIIGRIFLVRHGETNENKMRVIQGQMDTLCNEVGHHQAQLVSEALKDIAFDRAYSSDLSRAVITAETILAKHPGVHLERQEALRERHMGELQGSTVKNEPRHGGYRSLGNMDTAETSKAMRTRAIQWWKRWVVQELRSASDSNSPQRERAFVFLVATHGGFINTVIDELLTSRKLRLAAGVKREIVAFGDVSHLEGVGNTVDFNADEE